MLEAYAVLRGSLTFRRWRPARKSYCPVTALLSAQLRVSRLAPLCSVFPTVGCAYKPQDKINSSSLKLLLDKDFFIVMRKATNGD